MKTNKLLFEKYSQVREQLAGSGEMSAGGSTYAPEQTDVEVVPIAITWRDIGLFEPDSEEETQECEKAVEEIKDLFDDFQKELDKWQKKYKKIGALDTVAKEQIAHFVMKNVFKVEPNN